MATQRIGIRLTRYLKTDAGLEISPIAGCDCDEADVARAVTALLRQINAIDLPPQKIIGGELRPMTAIEVADYIARTEDQ